MVDDLLLTTIHAGSVLEQAGADQGFLLIPQADTSALEQPGVVDSLLITVEPTVSAGLEAAGIDLSALLTPVEAITTTSPSTEQVIDVVVVAAMSLGGHRVVRATTTGIDYASAEGPEVAAVLGVTTHAANAGDDITIRASGALTEPSWTWQPGPVYLASNGLLSQIPPTIGAIKEIGVALNSATLLIRIQPEINLG